VIATVAVTEDRFQVSLLPGRFALRPIPPEGLCIDGEKEHLTINAEVPGPYYLELQVGLRGTPVDGTYVPPPHP
jgi:hypothetical protein